MKILRLKIIANRINFSDLEARIKRACMWFQPVVDIQYDIVHTEYQDVPFVEQKEGNGTSLINAYSIEPIWYNTRISRLAPDYNIVCFLTDIKYWKVNNAVWGWRQDASEGPVELQVAAGEQERVYYQQDIGGGNEDAIFEKLRHELLHALFFITGQEDLTHSTIRAGKPEAARDMLIFQEPRTVDTLSIYRKIVNALAQILNLLSLQVKKIEMEHTDKINQMCLSIQKHEGWYKGSRSWRNSNPGNLRFAGQRLAVGKDHGNFCIFKTYEDGFTTLRNMITNAATGKSKVYAASDSLYAFFAKYAPAADSNQPREYAEIVARELAVSPTTQIKELL